MEKVKYYLINFGMFIPFIATIICLFISKNVGEPHAANATVAMWSSFALFGAWLVFWLFLQGRKWYETKKEIEAADQWK